MLEKVKDFFYDVSDVLLSILIIAIMFYTISWKLSDTMSYTPNLNLPFISEKTEVDEPETTVPDDATHVAIGEDSPAVSEGTDLDASQGEVIDMTPPEEVTQETPATSSEGTTPVETPTETPSEAAKPGSDTINVIAPKTVEFVVPSGMLASKIIQKLEDEGLIDSKSEFTQRLSERKLDSKLRSGTFNLSTDMNYDQIINKLTGQ
ncbi:MAG: endolytic transglycosylase MltG [Clostridia bacterium]|nr:endolytic transglycosylase MltG [Clostridia bacterium]